jgi:hypothetical protein
MSNKLRGAMSEEIQKVAIEKLGRRITLRELRLMPYVQYVMMNEQVIIPSRINQEEREVLSNWRKEGHIEGGASGLMITKEFWDAMSEILWLGYVS